MTRVERLLVDEPPERLRFLEDMHDVYHGVDLLFDYIEEYRKEIKRLKSMDWVVENTKLAKRNEALTKTNTELRKKNAHLGVQIHGLTADLEILRASSPADSGTPSIRGVRRE